MILHCCFASTVGTVLMVVAVLLVSLTPALGVERRYIVKMRAGAGTTGMNVREQAARLTSSTQMTLNMEFDHFNSMVVTLPEESVVLLQDDPQVELVIEDRKLYMIEPIPASGHQQGQRMLMEQIPYGISMVQAPEVWEEGIDGSGIKVCIIDSGIDADHPDLVNIPKNGKSTSGLPWHQDPLDACGSHGTHVAGTICASQNNNEGVAGVAPGVSLHIVDVFDPENLFECGGFFTSLFLDALSSCRNAGARVINMSLGGFGSFDQVLYEFFGQLKDEGIVVVVAAGNSGMDLDVNDENEFYTPGGFDNVITAAAVDSFGNRAHFSNAYQTVDFAAPGVAVLSTVDAESNTGGYARYDGTSMATPHVSGVVALLLSARPQSTADEVYVAMSQTAKDFGASGRDNSYGWGMVQAWDALEYLCAAGGGCNDGLTAPAPAPAPTEDCQDSPHGWYDSDGEAYNCLWYGQDDNCNTYGNGFANFGKTAQDACCVCGGGQDGGISLAPPSNPTGVCLWSAWLEECDASGSLIRRDNLADFHSEMTRLGNDGFHLTAVDNHDGNWIGYFEASFPTDNFRWISTSDFDAFVAELNRAFVDGYRAEAMTYGEGTHLAWFRYDPLSASSFQGRSSDQQFFDAIEAMLSGGFHMTAALGRDDGYWLGWFEESSAPSRATLVDHYTELQDKLSDFWSNGYYVTSIVHADDAWVVWGEQQAGKSKWATRATIDDIWDWIVDEWQDKDSSGSVTKTYCLSAITHGCDD